MAVQWPANRSSSISLIRSITLFSLRATLSAFCSTNYLISGPAFWVRWIRNVRLGHTPSNENPSRRTVKPAVFLMSLFSMLTKTIQSTKNRRLLLSADVNCRHPYSHLLSVSSYCDLPSFSISDEIIVCHDFDVWMPRSKLLPIIFIQELWCTSNNYCKMGFVDYHSHLTLKLFAIHLFTKPIPVCKQLSPSFWDCSAKSVAIILPSY